MLLRRALHGSTLAQAVRATAGARFSTTAVVSANSETLSQKAWRWADITGFFTKWHSRRAWILDLDPLSRAASVMMTEYERKLLLWLDITGFLTKWHSRRAWILDLDPPGRAAMVMTTEYERKLLLWLTFMSLFYLPIAMWYWYGQFTHLACKPPIPLMPEYQYMNGRKREFSFHGGRWVDCKECRWLEFECKKMCHDRLREEGRDVMGGRRPRSQTVCFH